jgi:hypothetical protein
MVSFYSHPYYSSKLTKIQQMKNSLIGSFFAEDNIPTPFSGILLIRPEKKTP